MVNHKETFEMLILFAKIVLALGATMLLFCGDGTSNALATASPQTHSNRMSLLSEVCLGVTFVASVILVAVWDCALAVLVCLFLVCWIAVSQKQKDKQILQKQQQLQRQQQRNLQKQSSNLSQAQMSVIQSQANRDNDVQYLYSAGTPLPTKNVQTSVPMAFTMGVRSYSTTVV